MACDKCKHYAKNGALSLTPKGLEEVFLIQIIHASSYYCIGNGSCKSCGQKIKFDYENLIYNKMFISVQEGKE